MGRTGMSELEQEIMNFQKGKEKMVEKEEE
jgi:hypothetical protein